MTIKDQHAIEAMRRQLLGALKEGKHSAYQQLPTALADILTAEQYPVHQRYERERLQFIARHVDFQKRTVLDIGANTGFFSFEALQLGARSVTCYEGWAAHAQIIESAARLLGCEDSITVHDRYYEFDSSTRFDIALLLNVLHHVGDDFGAAQETASSRLEAIARHMRSMANVTDTLVFQLGFNAQGNRNLPLFEHGTKDEMIRFVCEAASDVWHVQAIGVAEVQGGLVHFASLNDENRRRIDALGEFLNRPLFILHRRDAR